MLFNHTEPSPDPNQGPTLLQIHMWARVNRLESQPLLSRLQTAAGRHSAVHWRFYGGEWGQKKVWNGNFCTLAPQLSAPDPSAIAAPKHYVWWQGKMSGCNHKIHVRAQSREKTYHTQAWEAIQERRMKNVFRVTGKGRGWCVRTGWWLEELSPTLFQVHAIECRMQCRRASCLTFSQYLQNASVLLCSFLTLFDVHSCRRQHCHGAVRRAQQLFCAL